MWYFQRGGKDIMLKSFYRRKGKCKMCGKCCNFWGYKCPFLNKENKCRIYKWRPFVLCNLVPLNIDKENWKKHKKLNCGYYYKARHSSQEVN